MADPVRGRDLAIERRQAGLSQQEIADQLGVHKGVISNVELEKAGPIIDPAFATLFRDAIQRLTSATSGAVPSEAPALRAGGAA